MKSETYIISLCMGLLIAGCSNETENIQERKTSSVEASDFSLEVSAPATVEAGESMQVQAVLTYRGNEDIDLYHGEPIVRMSYSGEEGANEYNDIGIQSTLQPGGKMKAKKTFDVKKSGTQHVSASTTSLKVDGEYIEGKGKEEAVTDDMGEIPKNAAQSELVVDPIEIETK
ncbi:hypothetical protein [Salibacterium halotolerans]|uniref:Intracellular proteinase inhibitor n=1 Tax=Salibacterium halotolerans TaxID=1884432 RepID=A0A1I5SDP0_9BACI|nr:hypothetical protein [Salibacterium halotolerans]SFP68854.1 hypothetical protein SAMN05518683_108144 [Salibacterium halotolerans]